jgi:phosphonate transport system substrate-binding protein
MLRLPLCLEDWGVVMRKFRRFLAAVLLLLPAWAAPAGEPVRIGLTPVFLDDQTSFVESWRGYLEQRLGRPVVFSQRSSYRDIMDLLLQGKLDFAWVCGYPYVRYQAELQLTAVPLYQGEPLYRAYLIVPARDTTTKSLADLRDSLFAYSDVDSNSGHLVVQYQLLNMEARSGTFFRRSFFTGAHRKVVEAVAAGVADGGTVDGYVWDVLSRSHPELTSRTRVVSRTQSFGFPPLVARRGVSQVMMHDVQNALLSMNQDAEGKALLLRLGLDGFTAGSSALFDDIRHMMQAVREQRSAAQP